MDKMKMESVNIVSQNVDKIGALFPNCVTEISDTRGGIKKVVNFEVLKQMLSDSVSGEDEMYEFSWPGKKAAIVEANTPIRKTLRPCPEESRNWNNTQNIYIEGDNLETLKLLQESYLNSVKMIYIDPPYNTGNDYIYVDDFKMTADDYEKEIGGVDEQGNRLFKNTDSNGRFHSDWCSMIYSRLILARNLLCPDGVIFISMDDNEEANLKKICDEVFGEKNFIGEIIRKTKSMTADNGNGFNLQHEVLYAYCKEISKVTLHGEEKSFNNYLNPDNDPNGEWCAGDPSARSGGDTTYFGIENPYTGRIDYPPLGRYWAFSKSTLENYIKIGKIKFKKDYKEGERGFVFKRYKKDAQNMCEPVHSLFAIENDYMNQAATVETKKIFKDNLFSYPKPVSFIKKLIEYTTDKDSVIMDFFSGSATTAQAVMELNVQDHGQRKYIMVQLPEETEEKSAAKKAGYKNICEIGKERIRRVGDQIIKDSDNEIIDAGFRVFKLDDSNMRDVYYSAEEYNQEMLSGLESNIKQDRTDMDLLFGCLLEWGLPLSMPYKSENVEGCKVHTYNEKDLIVCFDENIPDQVIETIAKRKPMRVVFRDYGFENSPAKINVAEIFKLYSPGTKVKVI
ncbi:MAG: site-specific DNA-methyltransferase [Eubacterium sp.]